MHTTWPCGVDALRTLFEPLLADRNFTDTGNGTRHFFTFPAFSPAPAFEQSQHLHQVVPHIPERLGMPRWQQVKKGR